MRRFLLYFSYMGSRFGGMQRQPESRFNEIYPPIQGVLENAIQKLYPKNEALLATSSRTDKGVHAFMNTSHVDLEHPKDDCEYNCEWIKEQLNRNLHKSNHDIIIHNVRHVNSKFHCRHHAISRSYVYRLALTDLTVGDLRARVPISEINRCLFLRPPLSETYLLESARLLSGLHDFKTFSSSTSDFKLSTLREVEATVERNTGFMSSVDPSYDGIIFYDLHFKSISFLYNQIRRMVAVMMATAQGRMGLDDINYLLDSASLRHWPSKIDLAPAHGLYLRHVEYNESDLVPS